ncbi:thiopeptide-type bacteriocin biosynthesis protein [Streptomyces sp. NPDC014776]|uniref:thiopeptide-type bacteriocin biosynthesis protein n=1 Tax=unclassified Streptomyces TaxID=2593676 RepID=UPI0036F6628F
MQQHDIAPTEDTVLAVLGGTPIEEAAGRAGTSPTRLATAVERYRAAGRSALEQHPASWYQVNVQFTDHATAAAAFRAYLLPVLGEDIIGSWWFLRKHPYWRLRIQPAATAPAGLVATRTARALDSAVSLGVVREWRTTLYEPETTAFGGMDGMIIAHRLFHTDSQGVLTYHQTISTGTHDLPDAKITSLIVLTHLLRAAGLEWSEQGDVWAQVETRRALPTNVPPDNVDAMVPAMRKLLTSDFHPAFTDGPLTPLHNWVTGMQDQAKALAAAAHADRLTLGLRAILARHILFHWNRMGFNIRQQAIWSRAARQAILPN